ncbi:hypothetical protein, partial [Mediterranea massiliensis]|uniref:hypothetical protein n=1 Tax=Mediterranea massiliensis TaxID=1841865 RepID=UPI0025A4A70E
LYRLNKVLFSHPHIALFIYSTFEKNFRAPVWCFFFTCETLFNDLLDVMSILSPYQFILTS